MSVDCVFKTSAARDAGVTFERVTETRIDEETDQLFEQTIGYKVVCPNGATGWAINQTLFQCKNINPEIKEFFLQNVKGAWIFD